MFFRERSGDIGSAMADSSGDTFTNGVRFAGGASSRTVAVTVSQAFDRQGGIRNPLMHKRLRHARAASEPPKTREKDFFILLKDSLFLKRITVMDTIIRPNSNRQRLAAKPEGAA